MDKTTTPIELTDPKDIAFARIAQGALVNETILPSGYKTPARDMLISGTSLVSDSEALDKLFGFRRGTKP